MENKYMKKIEDKPCLYCGKLFHPARKPFFYSKN